MAVTKKAPDQPQSPIDSTILIKTAILFFLYVTTAYYGLKISPVSGFATLVWAPTGIAIAYLFLFGTDLWWGVFLGAFLANLLVGANPVAAFGIGVGNTLEAIVAVYLLKATNFNESFKKTSDALKFIIWAALISTLISPTVGNLSLLLTKKIAQAAFSQTWIAWWVGDILGALIVAPLIIKYWVNRHNLTINISRGEFILWVVTLVGVIIFVFAQPLTPQLKNSQLAYLVLPPLFWGALRLKQPYVSVSIFVLAILSIWGTVHGLGPFAQENTSAGLLLLQIFIGVATITTVIMTAAVYEARDSEEKANQLNKKLQENVKEVGRLNNILKDYIKDKNLAKPKYTQELIDR